MKQAKLKYRVKVCVNGKTMTNTFTHSKRRFLKKIGTINWQKSPSIYVCVTYGKNIDNYGKVRMFYNDGWYEERYGLQLAIKAFMEI